METLYKLNQMCRVCLDVNNKYEEMQSVLDDSVSVKLKICGGIHVDNEAHPRYPKLICGICQKNLQTAYNFRIKCENTERALKDLLEYSKTSEDSKPLETILCTGLSSEKIPDEYIVDRQCKSEKKFADNDSNSFDEYKLQHNEHMESTEVEIFNENCRNFKTVDNIKAKNIRKYVKKESKIKDLKEQIKVKRKYTKKNSTDCMQIVKNLKEDAKYVCEFCNIEYKGKSSFTYHMRRHANELNYVCEICGTAFETNFKLKRHFLKHMGTLPYSCKSCGMKFSSSSNRDRHVRRLHTTIRPFQCPFCEKAFSYSDQLKNHIRVHTGEKPYVCEKCGSAFKRKSHLSAHSNALTPCVVKMSLKSKFIADNMELETDNINKNSIKTKSSKYGGKKNKDKPLKTDVIITNDEGIEKSSIINECSTENEFRLTSTATKDNLSNKCRQLRDYEVQEDLNIEFYNSTNKQDEVIQRNN